MAQPTGFAEASFPNEERAATMEPSRTPSMSSESTLIWSPVGSTGRKVLSALKKQRLVDELRIRGFQCSGRKDDLVTRLQDDNTRLQTLLDTSSNSTTSQTKADGDDHEEAGSEAPDAIKSLRAEVDELRRLLTQQRGSHATSDTTGAPRPTATRAGDETDSQRYDGILAPATAANQQPAGVNRGAPPLSSTENNTATAPEGTSSMNEIVAMFARTQLQMTEALSRMSAPAPPVLIQSTNDTASAISEYDGDVQRNAQTWIAQVEHIAALAH